jgi:hypothetical protein
MKGGKMPRGFTVVETMIFLAVSALLFAAAIKTISGQQQRAEFNVGIREFQSRVNDIINDVSTGFYPYRSGLGCRVVGGTIRFDVSQDQGTSSDCIFIGKVIQFGPNDVTAGREKIRIFSVAGRRQATSGGTTHDSFGLTDSGSEPITGATDVITIPNGIRVDWVRYNNSGGSPITAGTPTGAVGFFTNFTKYSDTNASTLETAARNVNVLPFNGFSLDRPEGDAITAIRNSATSIQNPSGGITACLSTGVNTRLHVFVNIGGNLRQLTNDIEILGGPCP